MCPTYVLTVLHVKGNDMIDSIMRSMIVKSTTETEDKQKGSGPGSKNEQWSQTFKIQ